MWFIYSNWHFHRYLSPTLPRWTWSSSRRSGPLFPNKAMILIVDYISFTSWKWSSCLVMCFQILTHSTIWIRNGSQRKRFNKNPHKILLHYIVYVMILLIRWIRRGVYWLNSSVAGLIFRGLSEQQRFTCLSCCDDSYIKHRWFGPALIYHRGEEPRWKMGMVTSNIIWLICRCCWNNKLFLVLWLRPAK